MSIQLDFCNWTKQLDPEMISVVLPTYNRLEILKAAIQRICWAAQGAFAKIEIIVVDDGSTYPCISNSFLDTYEYEYPIIPKFQYIRLNKNSSTVSIPRNIGISHASGRYIAPVDDDCFCDIEKFRLLFHKIIDSKYSLVYGDRIEVKVDSWDSFLSGEQTLFGKRVHMPNHNKFDCGIDNGQFIYDAYIYEKIEPIYAINACDWELYKNIAQHSDFGYVDYPVCTYAWHDKNSSYVPKPQRTNPLNVLGDFIGYFRHGPFKKHAEMLVKVV